MIAKLYNALALFSIATLLALGGFGAFLAGSGRVNGQRLETIAAVLRGELDDRAEEAAEPEAAEPAAEAPATAQNVRRQPSAEEVAAARQRDHLHRQALERALRDLQAQKRLLDQTLQHALSEEERLAEQRRAWQQEQQKLTQEVREAGTERELELLASLPPKQAKEHILRVWQKSRDDAVALIMQLDVSKAKRIFAQMKTPEEQNIMSELLEQLRLQELSGEASASGTTREAAAP